MYNALFSIYFHTSNPMKDKPVRLARQLLPMAGKETSSRWRHDWSQFTQLKHSQAWLSDFFMHIPSPVLQPPSLPDSLLFFRLNIPSNAPYTSEFQTLYHTCHPVCHIFVQNNRTAPFQKDKSLLPEKSVTASDIGHGFCHLCRILKGCIPLSRTSATSPIFCF